MSCKSCQSGGGSGGGLFAIKEALVPLTLIASTLSMKKKKGFKQTRKRQLNAKKQARKQTNKRNLMKRGKSKNNKRPKKSRRNTRR